jgi:hypothetical protein
MLVCLPSHEAQHENHHFGVVMLEVRKLTSIRRVVELEGLCEVPKPLLMCPKPSPTINELMTS